MNALQTGIYTLYNTANTLKTALYVSATYPGMYLNAAPQHAPYPYCVYFIVTDDYDIDFSDERESVLVQFNLFDENSSSSNVGSILEKLKSLFDDCALTVSGWNDLFMVRNFVIPNNDFSQDTPIQGYSTEYEVTLEKQRS